MVEKRQGSTKNYNKMYKSSANSKELKPIRKQLRTHSTPAECVLWRLLKGSQIGGLKFRRQHSIGSYVMDFYCPTLRLAIELDGNIHQEMCIHEKDEEKEAFLNDNKITVMRFPNKWFSMITNTLKGGF